MITAKFSVELKDGLTLNALYLNDVRLRLTNGSTTKQFADGTAEFGLSWRISGQPGAALEISMARGGSPARVVVTSAIRQSDDGVRFDAKTIQLGD